MYNNKYLKVALVTPKVTLGKPLENAKEIIKVASENQDSGMLVYPELSITGYSIGDWVYNAQLLEETRQAVNYIKDASNEQILVIGAPVDVLGAIYDCGIVIQNKKLLGIVPKINLPNTSEFYEERFFTSGKAWKDKISEGCPRRRCRCPPRFERSKPAAGGIGSQALRRAGTAFSGSHSGRQPWPDEGGGKI